MKNKVLIVGIVLLFIGASVASGYQIYSSNNPQPLNRGWLYVGGSGPGNYSKIQDAINNGTNGDTIFVYSELYYENNISIDKEITIKGQDTESTILRCSNTTGFVIASNHVTITGFTIQYYTYGIISNGTNHSTISLNRIINCSNPRNSYAISLDSSHYNTISNNTIIDYHWGIKFFYNSDYNIISYNTLLNCHDSGIIIMHDSEYNLVFMNLLSMNDMSQLQNYTGPATGLYVLGECDSNNFSYNTITGWGEGIHIFSSNNNSVYMNNVTNCIYAIIITGHNETNTMNTRNRLPNVVKNNNFRRNIFGALSKFFTNFKETWIGNYWNRPKVLPKIILGVHAQNIFPVRLEFDLHPAQKPYDIPGMS